MNWYKKMAAGDRFSTCNKYRIWIQSRPRQEPPYYAAEHIATRLWLGTRFDLKGAKEACEAHAKGTWTG